MTALLLLLPAAACRANDPVVELKFLAAAKLAPNAQPTKGPAGEAAIEVTGDATESRTTLLEYDDPAITASAYVVRGRVKYDEVSGDGYLELWNDFGKKGTYFSRSLADRGGLKRLTGTSGWRDFELPFYAEAGMKPKRLTLNVVLPAGGKVVVAQPLVVAPLSVSGQWWTETQAGWLGGCLGVLFGVLGGLIGVASAWAKSRALTLSLCGIGLAIGGVSLIAGIAALSAGQPWHVYYGLLLTGVVVPAVLGSIYPKIRRQLQDDELRRMTAVDVA